VGKVVKAVVGAVTFVAGVVTGNFALIATGISLVGGALASPSSPQRSERAAAAAQLQIGETPRGAIIGRAGLDGSLVDAFNYGGDDNTDWEVLVIALADHECDALEGFFVNDSYVAFAGDGAVAGYNNQLEVYWRSGTWTQSVPSILTSHGPGWTANDRGRSVAYVVVAYKADDAEAESPVWPGGRPQFKWVVRGLKCYQARKDSSIGGSGSHRRDDPATWEWTENPIDLRYNWVRGIHAGDRIDEPGQLLIGRGLSAIEAPPQNVFARANLCDEIVDGQARYRVGGVVFSNEAFIDVEKEFAAACAGVIVQREGSVEIDPGEPRAAVAHFTDDNLIVGTKATWSDFLGEENAGWVNTVVARFVDPDQRWNERGAPVRREIADIVEDGAPREQQVSLGFVTNGGQAQRIAEITRRLGRLWGRGQVTLPPRFAAIEEDDWVTWQSDRRFGGQTLTFRVEAWGSDEGWRHQITLRQISASAFSDTAPLDDGSVASQQGRPSGSLAPGAGAWSLAAVQLDGGDVLVPALEITGANDNRATELIRFEYVRSATAPDAATVWTAMGASRPDTTRREIQVAPNATFYAAVSYVIDGVTRERLVLGPVTTGGLAGITFDPVSPINIQADSSGQTTTNLPIDRTIRMRRAGQLVTSGVAFSSPVVPGGITANAALSGGAITITVTQADAAGVILVPVTFAGQTYLREIVVNRSIASGQSGGGAGASGFTDTALANVSSTNFAQVSDVGAIVAASGSGELRFECLGQYDGAGAMEIVARYSDDGGATWTDAGASATGTQSTGGSGGQQQPTFGETGFVSLDRTVTGLTAGADYQVALFARRTSGSGTLSWFQPNFTVSQP